MLKMHMAFSVFSGCKKQGKHEKNILEKSILVLHFISAQFVQFTASNCMHLHNREALIRWTTDNIHC